MKIIVLLILSSLQVFAADLTIEIKNINSDEGDIFLAIWDSANGFPKSYETSIDQKVIPATDKSITFKNLKPGNYALAIFHDKNRDSQLNTNRLGIPTEGFGFSNNPRLMFGPPSFSKASFKLGDKDLTKTIYMKHF